MAPTFGGGVGTSVVSSINAAAPSINIDQESVHVNDIINVTGSGFGRDESGILITFDGIAAGSNIRADGNGLWSVSVAMPACVNGAHIVSARRNVTAAGRTSNRTINVLAKIVMNPTGGNVGNTINVSGTGFSGGTNISVTYGDVATPVNIVTDSMGNFSGNFEALGGKNGKIEVVATDTSGISASSAFAMDTTPPLTPQVMSPPNGNRVGFIGDTKVTFKWTDVTDPSGVFYDLQVSSDPDFQSIMIQRSGLTSSEYNTTDEEALPHGKYYWRVRADDGATNASDWTAPALIKAGFM